MDFQKVKKNKNKKRDDIFIIHFQNSLLRQRLKKSCS